MNRKWWLFLGLAWIGLWMAFIIRVLYNAVL